MGQQSADMCGLPAAGFTFDPPNLHSAIMTGLVRFCNPPIDCSKHLLTAVLARDAPGAHALANNNNANLDAPIALCLVASSIPQCCS